MLKWSNQFEGHIIGRGKKLAEEGAVVGLHWTLGSWQAMVVGTELYRVSVRIAGGQPGELRCSCPYAAEQGSCKHMAAVFVALGLQFPEILHDDDAALAARLDALSSDELEDALQFAIECVSTRCVAILLNRKAADGRHFSPEAFTLDDLPEGIQRDSRADAQGDNDPMKLLFPEAQTDPGSGG